jgi:DNA-binding transcriptional regulator YiaG
MNQSIIIPLNGSAAAPPPSEGAGGRLNYNLIYTEMLQAQFPQKLNSTAAKRFLENSNKKAIDIINFNQFISTENLEQNKRHICFDEASIKEMLQYQDENGLTNYETAKLYNISRMSLRKWKKHFSPTPPDASGLP